MTTTAHHHKCDLWRGRWGGQVGQGRGEMVDLGDGGKREGWVSMGESSRFTCTITFTIPSTLLETSIVLAQISLYAICQSKHGVIFSIS